MSCTCNQTFAGSATDLFNKLATAIASNGGSITGDATAGSFSVPTPVGTIQGTFTIDAPNQQLTVNITHRPAVPGCPAICKYIKDHL